VCVPGGTRRYLLWPNGPFSPVPAAEGESNKVCVSGTAAVKTAGDEPYNCSRAMVMYL